MANRPEHWEPIEPGIRDGLFRIRGRIEDRIRRIDLQVKELEAAREGLPEAPRGRGDSVARLSKRQEKKRALSEQLNGLEAIMQGYSREATREPGRWSQAIWALGLGIALWLFWLCAFRDAALRQQPFDEDFLLVLLGFAVALAAYFAQVGQPIIQDVACSRVGCVISSRSVPSMQKGSNAACLRRARCASRPHRSRCWFHTAPDLSPLA